MKLALYGISHHSCPIAQREQLSLTLQEQYEVLRKIISDPDAVEGLVLNTCNRLEFYIYASKNLDTKAFVNGIVASLRPAAAEVWQSRHYEHFGIDVVSHLFRVAAGLDSQMIGENQIVSQIKSAYAAALECQTSKFLFHRLMHSAFHVSKEVRRQTELNCGAVSVSLAAVEVAQKKIKFEQSTAMVIGAGENSELAAKYLVKFGIKELLIANRNRDGAEAMASRLKYGQVIAMDKIYDNLANVDLVIASTASTEPIIRYKEAYKVLSGNTKPLLIIDVAVPRDVEQEVANCPNVQLYNIDNLNEQVNANQAKYEAQIPKALAIVDEHVKEFATWLDSLSMVPVVSELTRRIVKLARTEARRYAKDFSGIKPEKLEVFAESLAKKIIHGPVSFIKGSGDDEPSLEQLQAANLINKMFLGEGQQRGEK